MNTHTQIQPRAIRREFVSAETATSESIDAALSEAFDIAFGYMPAIETPKLHAGFAAEIRQRLREGQSPKRIAHEVGCSVQTVYNHARKLRA
jgi:DNA-binding NarL/FixJ family response regulator